MELEDEGGEGRKGEGMQLREKMGAGKVLCIRMKAEGKGGHIVESRPGFLFVHSADKSLFVGSHTFPTTFSFPSSPLFSKHAPA